MVDWRRERARAPESLGGNTAKGLDETFFRTSKHLHENVTAGQRWRGRDAPGKVSYILEEGNAGCSRSFNHMATEPETISSKGA